jgi:hypothetical protein
VPAILDLSNHDLWYRVYHEEFDPNKVYKAIGYISFGETSWGQLLFVNEHGMTYAVMVYKTRCVNPHGVTVREATAEEAALGPAKPKGRNSCIDEIDR